MSPKTAAALYTRIKPKSRAIKKSRRKFDKRNYINPLKYLLRAEKKEIKREIGEIVYTWIVNWERHVGDKWTKSEDSNKYVKVKVMVKKCINRNNKEKNRQRRQG